MLSTYSQHVVGAHAWTAMESNEWSSTTGLEITKDYIPRLVRFALHNEVDGARRFHISVTVGE